MDSKKASPRTTLLNPDIKVKVVFSNKDHVETCFQCQKIRCYIQEKFNKISEKETVEEFSFGCTD